MMPRVLGAALLAASLLVPTPTWADIKLPALFSDGLVLQHGESLPLWGTASPEEMIRFSYEAKGERQGVVGTLQGNADILADKNGNWRINQVIKDVLPGGPYTFTFKGKNNTIVLKEVYIGEVWVCSGQSNMEMALNGCEGAAVAKAASKNPKIRLFTVAPKASATPETEVSGKWVECGPDTVGSFSAVAYYFGRDLQQALDVPVGLIHSSVGGTASEEWTSLKTLQANPKHLGKHPNQGKLYNGMIAPLMPYAIRGVIWYQGESNAGRAELYREAFPLLIQNWREDWKQGDFPFLFVQLAPFQKIEQQPSDQGWARLRDAQLETTRKVKNTGMAVITDVGDEENIHPKKKGPVGARLALLARATVYGEKIEANGPTYDNLQIDGNKAILTFSHVGQGLALRGDKLTGFTLAGADGQFQSATAEIKGDQVVVTCDKVKEPKAVRFGWANYPVVNLWNKDGLPASPFRTDNWPVGGPKK
jgi:sialate O-acetylesterase